MAGGDKLYHTKTAQTRIAAALRSREATATATASSGQVVCDTVSAARRRRRAALVDRAPVAAAARASEQPAAPGSSPRPAARLCRPPLSPAPDTSDQTWLAQVGRGLRHQTYR